MSANPTRPDAPGTPAGGSRPPQTIARPLVVAPPFDLGRTVAPAWWASGRWPSVDWTDGAFAWVGWEEGKVVWRSVRQVDARTLRVSGSGDAEMDSCWAARVLGTDATMPLFETPIVAELARVHCGMKPWSAGSLFEGVVSSIVGQSISVAAAATTERRLFSMFNDAITIGHRQFWPPPLPRQLASADAARIRASGVTTKRANALSEVAQGFTNGALTDLNDKDFDRQDARAKLLTVSGIGPWTVRSAFLWGIGDPDAHPTGDVALLRAVRRHRPEVSTLPELDDYCDIFRPYRGWAARLFWLDLLGFGD